MARNLEAQLQAELIEEERLARQKEEEANIALLESWDNTQAIMDDDFQLAQQMQTEEQEQLSIEEKSKLFLELLKKRKKHFAALRAQEKRSKPPTKAQKRNTMSTYLKDMAGYKHNQLKSKSYDKIQEISKRAGDELESDMSKKQKIDEHVEVEKDDQEEAEMKRHIEIVKDDEVAIDTISLATKPPVIVDYKIYKDGRMGYFKLISVNGSSKRYSSMIKMLQEETEEDDNPIEMNNVLEILRIEGNLFDFETSLCEAYHEFCRLLKINIDMFTYDIQNFKTYDEYKRELNDDKAKGAEKPWSENRVPYQLCDHICEPFHFKNIGTKWSLMLQSDNRCFCNRVGNYRDLIFKITMWYDELTDGKLKYETLALRAKIEGSWGDATPGVVKFCKWLKSCLENFHELEYKVLVKLQECWWKMNAHKIAPFTRMENFGRGPYANMKTEWANNPYLDINRTFRRDYKASNTGCIQ
ncbi:hypothetical protein Tco_0099352 [Tanacetum coccineum]